MTIYRSTIHVLCSALRTSLVKKKALTNSKAQADEDTPVEADGSAGEPEDVESQPHSANFNAESMR